VTALLWLSIQRRETDEIATDDDTRRPGESSSEDEFPDDYATAVRVVWWDDGGHLREVIRAAADRIGVGFSEAERFPLELRRNAIDEPETPHVWYIPQAKENRDWFRDIRETGGEIELTIEQLTAELYEVNPWDIYDVERGRSLTAKLRRM